jgi:hypothetical protein
LARVLAGLARVRAADRVLARDGLSRRNRLTVRLPRLPWLSGLTRLTRLTGLTGLTRLTGLTGLTRVLTGDRHRLARNRWSVRLPWMTRRAGHRVLRVPLRGVAGLLRITLLRVLGVPRLAGRAGALRVPGRGLAVAALGRTGREGAGRRDGLLLVGVLVIGRGPGGGHLGPGRGRRLSPGWYVRPVPLDGHATPRQARKRVPVPFHPTIGSPAPGGKKRLQREGTAWAFSPLLRLGCQVETSPKRLDELGH